MSLRCLNHAKLQLLRQLLFDLDVLVQLAIALLCDNVLFTYLVANLIIHHHGKHIKVDYHFACDMIAKGSLCVQFSPT